MPAHRPVGVSRGRSHMRPEPESAGRRRDALSFDPTLRLRSRKRPGLREGCFAAEYVRPETAARQVIPIEISGRICIRESDFDATALWQGLVLDWSDRHMPTIPRPVFATHARDRLAGCRGAEGAEVLRAG